MPNLEADQHDPAAAPGAAAFYDHPDRTTFFALVDKAFARTKKEIELLELLKLATMTNTGAISEATFIVLRSNCPRMCASELETKINTFKLETKIGVWQAARVGRQTASAALEELTTPGMPTETAVPPLVHVESMAGAPLHAPDGCPICERTSAQAVDSAPYLTTEAELRAEWARLRPEWDGPPFDGDAPLLMLLGYAGGILRSPPKPRPAGLPSLDREALRIWTVACVDFLGAAPPGSVAGETAPAAPILTGLPTAVPDVEGATIVVNQRDIGGFLGSVDAALFEARRVERGHPERMKETNEIIASLIVRCPPDLEPQCATKMSAFLAERPALWAMAPIPEPIPADDLKNPPVFDPSRDFKDDRMAKEAQEADTSTRRGLNSGGCETIAPRFSSGQIVRLASGHSPEMVVDDVIVAQDGRELVACVWFVDDVAHEKPFSADALAHVKKQSAPAWATFGAKFVYRNGVDPAPHEVVGGRVDGVDLVAVEDPDGMVHVFYPGDFHGAVPVNDDGTPILAELAALHVVGDNFAPNDPDIRTLTLAVAELEALRAKETKIRERLAALEIIAAGVADPASPSREESVALISSYLAIIPHDTLVVLSALANALSEEGRTMILRLLADALEKSATSCRVEAER